MGAFVRIELDVAGWRPAAPGQFVMLQPQGSARFLPRPFSVHRQRGEGLTFLIAPIGAGTQELAEARVGDCIWVLGPLGRGFDLAAMGAVSSRLVVVAGGVGVAPFLHLLEELVFVDPLSGEAEDAGYGFSEVLVLLGFRDAAQAKAAALFQGPVHALREAGIDARLEVVCEDGALGRCGLVTGLLEEELRRGDAIASCGAHGMCAAAWDLAQVVPEVRTWFSLEAPMACGVGSCQGCVIPGTDGSLVKVCRRGPVFEGEEVFLPGAPDGSCTPGGPGA